MPQKQSPRAPLHLKTTVCSENNSTHRTKPRSDDRRSPRSPLHEVHIYYMSPSVSSFSLVVYKPGFGVDG